MVNIKSSKKRIFQSEKRRKYNMSQRSMIRTYIKKVRFFIKNGDKKNASSAFSLLQPILDRQVNKKLFHRNKVARYKSNLMIKINSIKTKNSNI
ncbi:30S ribosomal protein S20 [Candidatus Westeberhardia cardiocondylae]|uniref:Small ribosomal subunit protein bS20 n=1 Tax=Candidatus Westeberhardia cardiocondylae TaxID=1594731 RepID=A0A0H5BX42_9ENTR|nr:30S ribosomal protein S20 [Candidatus Westeberhardia cardiocondylae]MCR3756234.1 30S ribosomal subunit protein S20 [Candidatus Westeberhardia cardiocondylae]CEN32340.1 30S ribosomal protein S20 [Candidatus Westeberhardia cardiocondylae]